ncbi:MAG: hypothetical protein HYU79_03550 [Nitrosomonadales bacterium]|nr:hypothetical protein [Nitrosomonadales bacterium]
MSQNVTDWVAQKLEESHDLEIDGRTPEDFLIAQRSEDGYTFLVAVLGLKNVIRRSDVEALFAGANKPQLIVNVPSNTLWSGNAIRHIHDASAAFGSLGDVSRAASTGDAGSYRDKNMGFFITAMEQHSNVSGVSYVYDSVFEANRKTGTSLTVAVIEAYNMSAEDVRNARARLGNFDVIVKSSSYGSITSQAKAAANSIVAEALTFGDLMQRLGKK